MANGWRAAAAALALILFGVAAPPASAATETFPVPGGASWIVPADTSSARFSVVGAAGGDAIVGPTTIPGGLGGTTLATLDVVPETEYTLRVGSAGEDSNAPGTPGEGGGPGGGDGANAGPCATFTCSGAGGGGGTFVSIGFPSNPANVLLVGAGGGGAGFDAGLSTRGGDGGGLTGQAGGTDGSCTAAGGGNQDGTSGSGSYAAGDDGEGDAGGGGGGGWYGGAGGEASGSGEGCGGAGGSGHLAAVVRSGSFPAATNSGDGSIAITYFTLSVTVSGQGSVSGTGISCGGAQTDCTESFAPGDLVSLTATPAAGMEFDGFSGACSGTVCQVAIAADGTVSAAFSPPDPEPPPEAEPPDTTITKAPRKKTRKKSVSIPFVSSPAGSTFECQLDDKGFAPCTSPFTAKVKKGKHHFEVRAIGPTGLTDATPAEASWKVKKKKKKKKRKTNA
jgi:hypothetical protein